MRQRIGQVPVVADLRSYIQARLAVAGCDMVVGRVVVPLAVDQHNLPDNPTVRVGAGVVACLSTWRDMWVVERSCKEENDCIRMVELPVNKQAAEALGRTDGVAVLVNKRERVESKAELVGTVGAGTGVHRKAPVVVVDNTEAGARGTRACFAGEVDRAVARVDTKNVVRGNRQVACDATFLELSAANTSVKAACV